MSYKIPVPGNIKGHGVNREELQRILEEIRRALIRVQEALNDLDKKKQDKP